MINTQLNSVSKVEEQMANCQSLKFLLELRPDLNAKSQMNNMFPRSINFPKIKSLLDNRSTNSIKMPRVAHSVAFGRNLYKEDGYSSMDDGSVQNVRTKDLQRTRDDVSENVMNYADQIYRPQLQPVDFKKTSRDDFNTLNASRSAMQIRNTHVDLRANGAGAHSTQESIDT